MSSISPIVAWILVVPILAFIILQLIKALRWLIVHETEKDKRDS